MKKKSLKRKSYSIRFKAEVAEKVLNKIWDVGSIRDPRDGQRIDTSLIRLWLKQYQTGQYDLMEQEIESRKRLFRNDLGVFKSPVDEAGIVTVETPPVAVDNASFKARILDLYLKREELKNEIKALREQVDSRPALSRAVKTLLIGEDYNLVRGG